MKDGAKPGLRIVAGPLRILVQSYSISKKGYLWQSLQLPTIVSPRMGEEQEQMKVATG